VAHAGFDTAHAVVELGCGTGRFAAALLGEHLPPDASYVGVDVSSRMVALASERLARWRDRATVTFVDGGAGVPVADGTRDRFVANYVFDLWAREARCRRRVLAPGGLPCAADSHRAGGLAVRVRVDGRVVALARSSAAAARSGCRHVDRARWEIRRAARSWHGASHPRS
jgi:SAM-dependent methyltransferase